MSFRRLISQHVRIYFLVTIVLFTVSATFPDTLKMSVKTSLPNDLRSQHQTAELIINLDGKEIASPLVFSILEQKRLEIKVKENGNFIKISKDKLKVTEDPSLDKYVDKSKTLKDDKTLTVALKPTGKTDVPTDAKGDKIALKLSYNNDTNLEKSLQLRFGLVKVTLEPIANSTFHYGGTKKFALKTDGNNIPQESAIKFKKNDIVEVSDTEIKPEEFALKAIKVGKKKLEVTINEFEYELDYEISVDKDKLTKIILKENDKPINPTSTNNNTQSFDISISERTEKTFEIIGKFSSGESRKLGLNPFATLPQNHEDLEDTVTAGTLVLEAKSLGEGDETEFTLTNDDVKEKIEENNNLTTEIKKISIKVEIKDTNYILQVFTPRTGNLLLPGGRVNIETVIRKETNGRKHGAEKITFKIKNKKEEIWAKLIPEGANASLLWENPTPQQLRDSFVKNSTSSETTKDKKKPAKKLPQRPPILVLSVEAEIENQTLYQEFAVRFLEIEKFAKLDVKLNIMDDQTAKDLYGPVAARDYYVLMVRLFNNLLDEETKQPTGNSIIAYSGSMEVAVGLEKKYDKKNKSSFSKIISKKEMDEIEKEANKPKPKPVAGNGTEANTEIDGLNGDLKEELKNANDKLQKAVRKASKAIKEYDKKAEEYENEINQANYETAKLKLTDANNAIYELRSISERIYRLRENIARLKYAKRAKIRADRIGLNAAINDGKWHPVIRSDLNRLVHSELVPRFQSFLGIESMPKLPAPEKLKAITNFSESGRSAKNADPPCYGTVTYRPLTFEMIVNTVDRREERSFRSRVFTALNFVGTGTSFITSFAVPGAGSDLPLGLEKYTNLLIPGLNKLFPSKKGQHRQNVVSQTMKPIEEIPYGADITRVIFVPRKPFSGLIRGHKTRISEICPYFFKIDVAVVKNSSSFQKGLIP